MSCRFGSANRLGDVIKFRLAWKSAMLQNAEVEVRTQQQRAAVRLVKSMQAVDWLRARKCLDWVDA